MHGRADILAVRLRDFEGDHFRLKLPIDLGNELHADPERFDGADCHNLYRLVFERQYGVLRRADSSLRSGKPVV